MQKSASRSTRTFFAHTIYYVYRTKKTPRGVLTNLYFAFSRLDFVFKSIYFANNCDTLRRMDFNKSKMMPQSMK